MLHFVKGNPVTVPSLMTNFPFVKGITIQQFDFNKFQCIFLMDLMMSAGGVAVLGRAHIYSGLFTPVMNAKVKGRDTH